MGVDVTGGGGLATVNQTAGTSLRQRRNQRGRKQRRRWRAGQRDGWQHRCTGVGIDVAGAAVFATTGNVAVTTAAGHTINAGDIGIRAQMQNAGATGNVQVTANGAVTSTTNDGIRASTVATAATSTVTVTVGNNITAGNNAADRGVRASGINGLVTVNQTAGTIASTGTGIDATSSGSAA